MYANLLALLVVSVASVVSSAVRERRDRELSQVRRIAEVSQNVVLRPLPARMGGVHTASVYMAAERGAQIGGDLYEAVGTRYGVRLIVGDVRGKGLAAVRSAAAVLGAFREAVHYEPDLIEVMQRCAAALGREYELLDRSRLQDWDERAEQFVTVLLAQVVPDTSHGPADQPWPSAATDAARPHGTDPGPGAPAAAARPGRVPDPAPDRRRDLPVRRRRPAAAAHRRGARGAQPLQ